MKPSATSLAVVLLVLLGGCSTTRVPTAADQQAILTALVRYEESRGCKGPAANIRPEIEVKGQRVWAKYAKSRNTEKLANNPIAVRLEKREGDWVGVSEEPNWPLSWRIVQYMSSLWWAVRSVI